MEKSLFTYCRNAFFSTGECEKNQSYSQPIFEKICFFVFHSLSFHISQALWKNLQAGVDVGSDVPNVILQVSIAFLKLHFHLPDGIERSGVIPCKFPADIRQT